LLSFYEYQLDHDSEKLPNLMKINRLRRSALCGQMRTMGGHRGPGRV
jgi:hypothetical protein